MLYYLVSGYDASDRPQILLRNKCKQNYLFLLNRRETFLLNGINTFSLSIANEMNDMRPHITSILDVDSPAERRFCQTSIGISMWSNWADALQNDKCVTMFEYEKMNGHNFAEICGRSD